MTRLLRHFGLTLIMMLLLLMMLAGCSALPKATTTSSTTLSPSPLAANQTQVPASGTTTERGIVTEHTNSDFTLITDIGRLVFNFNKSTLSERVDLSTQQIVTEPLNENSLFLGAQVFVEYYPTTNLAVRVVFNESTKVLFTLLSGTITQISGQNIYADVILSGVTRNLLIKYNSYDIVVIRSDSSRGNVSELNQGMKIRVFLRMGTNGAAAIEIE
jgi:hypothetical protein